MHVVAVTSKLNLASVAKKGFAEEPVREKVFQQFQRLRPALNVGATGLMVGHALVCEYDLGAGTGSVELHRH